jgi:hypothetical protein
MQNLECAMRNEIHRSTRIENSALVILIGECVLVIFHPSFGN